MADSIQKSIAQIADKYELPPQLLQQSIEYGLKTGDTPMGPNDAKDIIARKHDDIKGDPNSPEYQFLIYAYFMAERLSDYFDKPQLPESARIVDLGREDEAVLGKILVPPQNNYHTQINHTPGGPFVPSDRLIAMTKKFEGFVPVARQQSIDRLGVISVGYGHTNFAPNDRDAAVPGRTVTEPQATEILIRDMMNFGAAVAKKWPGFLDLPQSMQDACVSYAFGCGVSALMKSKAVELIKSGDLRGGAAAFADGIKTAKGVVLGGLVKKRTAEAKLAALDLDGVESKPVMASTVPTNNIGTPVNLNTSPSTAGRVDVAHNHGSVPPALAQQQTPTPAPGLTV